MIILAAYLIVLVSVPLCGGNLAKLGSLRIHKPWAIAVAMALQILVVNVVEERIPFVLGALIHLCSYGFAFVFVWANRRLAGIGVVVAGGLMNLAAIAANGGVMPASPGALERAGRSAAVGKFQNSTAVDHPKLWFLGDALAWPAPLPLANVFSVGDVLLVLGAGYTLHVAAGSRLATRRRGRHAAGARQRST